MSDFQESSVDDLQTFVDCHAIPALAPPEFRALMEIARFPHWENVFSNILAFFLDTDRPHGFGPLFVRSVLAAYSSPRPRP